MSALNLDAYSLTALALLGLSGFLAGLARGFSGFGAALIFIPLASAVAGPRIAAPVFLLIDFVAAAGLIPPCWGIADKREVGTILVGTLLGVPIGVFVLAHTDPIVVRWVIAGMIFPLLAILISGWRYRGRPTAPLSVGVGSLAGFFSGLAQVGGPPVLAYWLGSAKPPQVVRSNIVIYFAGSTVIAMTAYLLSGMLTTAIIAPALIVFPAYAVALYLGSRMFGLASEATFRAVTYTIIALGGLVSMPIFDGFIR